MAELERLEMELVALELNRPDVLTSDPFHALSMEAPGRGRFTANGRDALLAMWDRPESPRPLALKPLHGQGKILALVPCDKAETGRILLRWYGQEVWVNLRHVLAELQVEVPRGYWMDVKMQAVETGKWGKVLVGDLARAPVREKGRRSNGTRPALMQAAASKITASSQ